MLSQTQIAEINHRPSDFLLLEILPAMKWKLPVTLNEAVGETINVCIVDCETTGLDAKLDEIIELGFVSLSVDISNGNIVNVERMGAYYNEPKAPIDDDITRITGITDSDVKGHTISMDIISSVFKGADLIVAHNAKFDRSFIDNHINALGYSALSIPWACSIKDVDWRTLGYESNALGYLAFKQGYFFTAHRACEDCLATAFVLHTEKTALQRILKAYNTPISDLRVNSRFAAKDALKKLGCTWDSERRQWHKVIVGNQDEIDGEIKSLKTADSVGKISVDVLTCSPLTRYASE